MMSCLTIIEVQNEKRERNIKMAQWGTFKSRN